MRVVISKTGRFIGRLSIQIVPSVTASVVGGYLLAQLVPQHAAAPATSATPVSQTVNGTPVANDRAPIRVVPPARRDAQASEPPAEVKRVEAKPAEKPAEVRAETRQAAVAPAVTAAPETKVPRVKPAAPVITQQVYTPEPYTPEADLPQVASQPVLTTAPAPKPAPQITPPPVVASAPPLPAPTSVGSGVGAPTELSPVVVNAQRPIAQPAAPAETVAAAEPTPQREHGVFSTISNAAGTAANVTGDTINWVIDLPGKLIGQNNQDNRQQQQAAQPRRFM